MGLRAVVAPWFRRSCPGSAGEAGGLRPGDVLLELDGQGLRNAQDFLNAEGLLPVGRALQVTYLRDGEEGNAQLEIEAAQLINGIELGPRFAGAQFVELPASARAGGVSGVMVESLERDSRLAFEGLRPGDVITAVNRKRTDNLEDLRRAMNGIRGPVLLQLRRDGQAYVARID